MTKTSRRRSTGPIRRGVASVELAVCLPALALLVLGSIEACNVIFLEHSLTISSYEGVRVAIQHDASNAEVTGKCNQILTARHVNGPSVTITPSDVAGVPAGQTITIAVSAPCDANAISPSWFFGGRSLTAETVMVKE